MLVAVGGRVVCLDYVSRSDVYAGLYVKLLRGYALEAIEQPEDAPVPEDYVRLLRRIARAKRGPGTQHGLGVDRDLAGRGVAGSELTSVTRSSPSASSRQGGRKIPAVAGDS